ncbi:MAG TPA: histidine phosphatase family protein [Stellaceae bacterium]|nr:histidine phosphatase family protein [Stellaceae bacterium]
MSELYLLRHAKAVPATDGAADRDRPLEPRGRRAAQAMGAWIGEHHILPDLVLCSPSLRTRQTLDIITPGFDRPPKIALDEGLYLAAADRLLARLRRVPASAERVLLVGHNPALHELTLILAESPSGPLLARLGGFPTGALVRFEVGVPWEALGRRTARLASVINPKELVRGL